MYSLPYFHTCWLNSDLFLCCRASPSILNAKSLFRPMSKSLFSGGADHVAQIINSSGLYTTWHGAPAVIPLPGSYDSCSGKVPGPGRAHQSLSGGPRWWIARRAGRRGPAPVHTPRLFPASPGFSRLASWAGHCQPGPAHTAPCTHRPPHPAWVKNETNPNAIMSLIMHLIQL